MRSDLILPQKIGFVCLCKNSPSVSVFTSSDGIFKRRVKHPTCLIFGMLRIQYSRCYLHTARNSRNFNSYVVCISEKEKLLDLCYNIHHLSLYLAMMFASKYVTCSLYDVHSKLLSYKLKKFLMLYQILKGIKSPIPVRSYLAL